MRKTILVGSIIASFLMLMIPSISAVEYHTIHTFQETYTEEEFIQSIHLRMKKIEKQNSIFNIDSWDGDDPDGPFEGGLDDITDWFDLIIGLIFGGTFLLFIKNQILQKALATEDLYTILIWIYDYFMYSVSSLRYLGDAFDIIDPDENGS